MALSSVKTKIQKNKKVIIAVCLLFFTSFVSEKVFFSELRSQSRNISNDIRVEEIRLREDMGLLQVKDRIFADYEQCKSFLKTTELSDKDVKAKLLRETENIVRAAGGSVVNLTPREEAEAEPMFKIYKADIQLEMTFGQLLQFLYNLQNSKLLIKLDQFSVSSNSKTVEKLKIDGVISIAVPS